MTQDAILPPGQTPAENGILLNCCDSGIIEEGDYFITITTPPGEDQTGIYRRPKMGDKGGKKDKEKIKKQADKKHDDKDKAAKEKQPKQKP